MVWHECDCERIGVVEWLKFGAARWFGHMIRMVKLGAYTDTAHMG